MGTDLKSTRNNLSGGLFSTVVEAASSLYPRPTVNLFIKPPETLKHPSLGVMDGPVFLVTMPLGFYFHFPHKIHSTTY